MSIHTVTATAPVKLTISPKWFIAGVSRQRINKSGNSMRSFSDSFRPEFHDTRSLFDDVIQSGFSFTMNHKRVKPGKIALARNSSLVSFRHTENFLSQQALLLDFDNKVNEAGLYEKLLSDKFLSEFAAIIHHSSSSTPETNKIHVIFVLDTPVLSAAKIKMIYKTLLSDYPLADSGIKDCCRIVNGAKDCLGRVEFDCFLPLALLDEKIAFKQNEAIKENDINVASNGLKQQKNGIEIAKNDSRILQAVKTNVNNLITKLGNKQEGENRHRYTGEVGLHIGSMLKGKGWGSEHAYLIREIESGVREANYKNGYTRKYSESGLRTFRDCFRMSTPNILVPRYLLPEPQPTIPQSSPEPYQGMRLIQDEKQELLKAMRENNEFKTGKGWNELILKYSTSRQYKYLLEKLVSEGTIEKQPKDKRMRPGTRSNPFIYGIDNY